MGGRWYVCVCVGRGDITHQERSLWLLFRFLRDIHKHPACLVSQQHHHIIMKKKQKKNILDHYWEHRTHPVQSRVKPLVSPEDLSHHAQKLAMDTQNSVHEL